MEAPCQGHFAARGIFHTNHEPVFALEQAIACLLVATLKATAWVPSRKPLMASMVVSCSKHMIGFILRS
jgi:hypothetical protein